MVVFLIIRRHRPSSFSLSPLFIALEAFPWSRLREEKLRTPSSAKCTPMATTINPMIQDVGFRKSHERNTLLPGQARGLLGRSYSLDAEDPVPEAFSEGLDERLGGAAGTETDPRAVRHQLQGPPDDAGTPVGLRPPSVPASDPSQEKKEPRRPAPNRPWRSFKLKSPYADFSIVLGHFIDL